MSRPLGSIDKLKTARVLDAAADLIAERGLSVPLEDIALRAGVSKQTLYNHYGGRAGLVEALAARRHDDLSAPLVTPVAGETPQDTLTRYALALTAQLAEPRFGKVMRALVWGLKDQPDLARRVHRAATEAPVRRLQAFLRAETSRGRLRVDDPASAAEMFFDLITAGPRLRFLIDLAEAEDPDHAARRARQAAALFVRAHAPPAP